MVSDVRIFLVFMAVKVQVEVFWVVTSCSVVVGQQRFGGTRLLHLNPELGGSMDFTETSVSYRNSTQSHTSQYRRRRLETFRILHSNYSGDTFPAKCFLMQHPCSSLIFVHYFHALYKMNAITGSHVRMFHLRNYWWSLMKFSTGDLG
jgi:hypothetical protein